MKPIIAITLMLILQGCESMNAFYQETTQDNTVESTSAPVCEIRERNLNSNWRQPNYTCRPERIGVAPTIERLLNKSQLNVVSSGKERVSL